MRKTIIHSFFYVTLASSAIDFVTLHLAVLHYRAV
jgi:hypothetical protein